MLWYNRVIWIVLGLFTVVVFFVATFQEPLEGDLTRTGGFSEKRFGWQGEQEYFQKPFLFRIGTRPSDLDQHYDVVVLGDSFTFRSGNSWASFLYDLTGWKIIAFHHRDITLEELVSSPEYRQRPPSLLIFQTVERWVVKRLSELRDLHSIDGIARKSDVPLTVQQQDHPREMRGRETEFDDINARLSAAVHQTRVRVKETMTGRRHAQIMPLRDGAPSLFSSREQASALVLAGDLQLREIWAHAQSKAAVGYRRARAVIRSHGVEFAVLVFPDKLTVYADYFADSRWRDTSFIPGLADQFDLPRLDLAYAQALAAGTIDLYPPNNTHSGSIANRLAADTLMQFLNDQTHNPDSLLKLDLSDWNASGTSRLPPKGHAQLSGVVTAPGDL